MYVSTKLIILKSLKFKEKSLIVHGYTQDYGLKSFIVPTAYSNNKKKQKAAYFLPLSILEIDFNLTNKDTLNHFKSIQIAEPYTTVHSNIFKNSIALFLAEMLTNSLKESGPDQELYQFLEASLLWLDHNETIANFHIITLLKLTKYLGFSLISSSNGNYFDYKNGTFTFLKNDTCFNEVESSLIKKGLLFKYDDAKNHLTGTERQLILQLILKYYQVHIDKFKIPHSLAIFKELFN